MRCDNLSDCRRAHSLVRLLLFRITVRITGPGVDFDERSERTTSFRLRFIRLFCRV